MKVDEKKRGMRFASLFAVRKVWMGHELVLWPHLLFLFYFDHAVSDTDMCLDVLWGIGL